MLKLIVAFSYTCLLTAMFAAAAQRGEKPLVFDTNGHPLQRGVYYSIEPHVTNAIGNGLTPVVRNKTCSLFVGIDRSPKPQGYFVTFSPFSKNEAVVRESSDFSVAFRSTIDLPSCGDPSTAWTVGEVDPKNGMMFIGVGGKTGYFRIEKNEVGAYKFYFCPLDVCPNCRHRCGDVGQVIENGMWLLAVGGPPLTVKFKRG